MSLLSRRSVAVRRAPWGGAAPLILITVVVVTAALVASSARGWGHVFGGPSESGWTVELGETDVQFTDRVFGSAVASAVKLHGAAWSAELAALIVACVVTGRRWLTVALFLVLAVVVAGWVGVDRTNLEYVEAAMAGARGPGGDDGPLAVGIAMYGVVGLLMLCGFVTAVIWASSGMRSGRRGRPAASDPPTRGPAVPVVVVATVAALLLPSAALGLRALARPTDPSLLSEGNQTIYLLVIVMAVVYVGAVVLARRWPAGATAAIVVGAALWIPAVWLGAGLMVSGTSLLDGPAAGWLLWLLTLPAGLILGTWIAVRAGRAVRPHDPRATAAVSVRR